MNETFTPTATESQTPAAGAPELIAPRPSGARPFSASAHALDRAGPAASAPPAEAAFSSLFRGLHAHIRALPIIAFAHRIAPEPVFNGEGDLVDVPDMRRRAVSRFGGVPRGGAPP